MMQYTFLTKQENGKLQFLFNGAWCVETSTSPVSAKQIEIDFILKNLFPVKRSKMIGLNYEYEGLPSDLRRLAGFNWQKTSAHFTISEYSADFATGKMVIQNEWDVFVKEDHKDQEYPVDCKIKIIQTVTDKKDTLIIVRNEEWQNE